MDFKKLFGTDKKREIEGVEIDLGEGLKVRVARANNARYRELYNSKMRQYRVQLRNRNLPEDVVLRIQRECFAETILLGWVGATDNGVPIEYSRENAIAMMEKYPDFADTIVALATDIENFQEQDEQAAQGNSPSPSSGTSSASA